MKKLLLLLLFAMPALAVQPEVGVGWNHAVTLSDGVWYDENLPHAFRLDVFAWTAGVGYAINDRLSVHADYFSSGVIHSYAIAVGLDTNYDPKAHKCIGPCNPLASYVGSGTGNGVKLSVELTDPRWGPFFIAGGPLLYYPKWAVNTETISGYVAPNEHGYWQNIPAWHIGATAGIGVNYGRWQARMDGYFECLNNVCKSQIYTPVWRNMVMTSINWRWR